MENCKGCLGIINNCYYSKYVDKFNCPCVICLVKVVCRRRCNEFDKSTEQYIKIMKEPILVNGQPILVNDQPITAIPIYGGRIRGSM